MNKKSSKKKHLSLVLTDEQKKFIKHLEKNDVEIRQNNDDEECFDIDGDVDLSGMGLVDIPIKFGIINGNLDISNNFFKKIELNKILKDLKGNLILTDNHFLTRLENFSMQDNVSVCKVKGEILCKNTSLVEKNVKFYKRLPESEGLLD